VSQEEGSIVFSGRKKEELIKRGSFYDKVYNEVAQKTKKVKPLKREKSRLGQGPLTEKNPRYFEKGEKTARGDGLFDETSGLHWEEYSATSGLEKEKKRKIANH